MYFQCQFYVLIVFVISYEVQEGSNWIALFVLYFFFLYQCIICVRCIININGVKNKNGCIFNYVRKVLLCIFFFQIIKLRFGEIIELVSDSFVICLIVKFVFSDIVVCLLSWQYFLCFVFGSKQILLFRVGIFILGLFVD